MCTVLLAAERIGSNAQVSGLGSGCGETYTGEWCSTPPDACDPCADGTYVGGAIPCLSPCWFPGKGLLNFIGGVARCTNQRLCQFSNCVASQARSELVVAQSDVAMPVAARK